VAGRNATPLQVRVVENCGAGPRPSLVECADKTSSTTPPPLGWGGGIWKCEKLRIFSRKKKKAKIQEKNMEKGLLHAKLGKIMAKCVHKNKCRLKGTVAKKFLTSGFLPQIYSLWSPDWRLKR
jgi:hypothetical protein